MKDATERSIRLIILEEILKNALELKPVLKEGKKQLQADYEPYSFQRYCKVKFFKTTCKGLSVGIHKMLNGGAHILFVNSSIDQLKKDIEIPDKKNLDKKNLNDDGLRRIYPDAVISLRRKSKEELIEFVLRPERGQDIKLSNFSKNGFQILMKILNETEFCVKKRNKAITKAIATQKAADLKDGA